jgi:hypothetical protein
MHSEFETIIVLFFFYQSKFSSSTTSNVNKRSLFTLCCRRVAAASVNKPEIQNQYYYEVLLRNRKYINREWPPTVKGFIKINNRLRLSRLSKHTMFRVIYFLDCFRSSCIFFYRVHV